MPRLLHTLIGLLVGAALCAALLWRMGISVEEWKQLAENISYPWAMGTTLLTGLIWIIGAHKWSLWSEAMHGAAGKEPSAGFFLRHYAWQGWVGQFVPSTLAIILGRSLASRHMTGVNWKAGAGSGFLDQLMDFALLVSLIPASVLLIHSHAPVVYWAPAAIGGMSITAGLVLLVRPRLPKNFRPFVPALIGWSATRVIVYLASVGMGVKALGLDLDPVITMAAKPLVALVVAVPLTPSNLGIADWGTVGVLTYAGSSVATAGMFALGFRLLQLVAQTLLLLAHEIYFRVRYRHARSV